MIVGASHLVERRDGPRDGKRREKAFNQDLDEVRMHFWRIQESLNLKMIFHKKVYQHKSLM